MRMIFILGILDENCWIRWIHQMDVKTILSNIANWFEQGKKLIALAARICHEKNRNSWLLSPRRISILCISSEMFASMLALYWTKTMTDFIFQRNLKFKSKRRKNIICFLNIQCTQRELSFLCFEGSLVIRKYTSQWVTKPEMLSRSNTIWIL